MSRLNELEKIYLQGLDGIYSKKEIKSIFRLIVLQVLEIDSISFLITKDDLIISDKIKILINYLDRLKKNEPVQYILGYTDFLDKKIKVNKHVLIPRKETEELVNWCKSFLKDNDKIIDIGTGSGCIAISLAGKNKVTGLDICKNALKIAKYNAQLNKVNIDFIQQDVLKFNKTSKFIEKQNVIISNPPYVKIDEIKKMHKNVYMYEPKSAIFVSDDNPLIFYEKIILFSMNNLVKNGLIFLEINESFGKKIVSLLKKKKFQDIELQKDIHGKNRMVKAVLN
jgi:release factor glutamine methyltransferase